MKAFSALMLAVPVTCTANLMNDEYSYLARLREISEDSFELAFDLNGQLATLCEYTVPGSELLMNTDYFTLPRAYTNLGGRNEFYYKSLSQIRCDDPIKGFMTDLNQSQNPVPSL